MAVTPPLMMHTKGFEPTNLDNFNGKRIRYAGAIWQGIIEAMGGAPVPVPPAETADAMGKGVIDAATFPFEATIPFDLAPVTDYSLTPGIAGATFSVVIGDMAYNRLSDAHKALVDETTGPDRAEAFGAMWDAGEARGQAYMEEGGVKVVALDNTQIATLEAMLSTVVDALVAEADGKGLPASDFVSAYTR
jgi:TRAP-type C4-dicarboxylate transport system substrate-binding protein